MISIITPTYNRIESLKLCISSFIEQDNDGFELIIIDDCSTDGTWEYLIENYKENDKIKLLQLKLNQGVNYARNRGIEKATGSYIIFLDSDDQLVEGALQKISLAIVDKSYGHYLCWLSYRTKEPNWSENSKLIYYKDWVKGEYQGDFMHVVKKSVLLEYPFFENFRMYEQLNWFRIYKSTSPQLLLPIVSAEINLESDDSLSKSVKAKSFTTLNGSFDSELIFLELYEKDLQSYNPGYLSWHVLKLVLIGIVCEKGEKCKTMLGYSNSLLIHLLGKAILSLPQNLIRTILIKLLKIK